MMGNRGVDQHRLRTFGVSPAVVMARRYDVNALPDATLMACLAAYGRRPNILVECSSVSYDAVVDHLMSLCARPVRTCALPGPLALPATKDGTLLLRDAAALSLSQQVQLYDWLSIGCANLQVISLTTLPLRELVEDGAFLEGLYYRLNVIRLDAAVSMRSIPGAGRQQTT
jgi:transcriptional regulator of aromatic amino acid metabolism